MLKVKVVKSFENKPSGYYVYLHRKLSDGEIFYVGKGSQDRAWKLNSSSKPRNSHWVNVARKHGVLVEIYQDCLLEEEALDLEQRLISEIGRIDLGTGPLVNKSNGGESGTGIVFSEEYLKNSRKRGLALGVKVIVDNSVCFYNIKGAAEYLAEIHNKSKQQAVNAITAALKGRQKSCYGHVVHGLNESYEERLKKITVPKQRIRLTNSLIYSLYDRYLNGETARALANEVNYSYDYIAKIFSNQERKYLNMSQKKIHKPKFDLELVLEMYNSLGATKTIKELGISKTHLYRLLKKE